MDKTSWCKYSISISVVILVEFAACDGLTLMACQMPTKDFHYFST